jgi:hypothetical protein
MKVREYQVLSKALHLLAIVVSPDEVIYVGGIALP